jgi:hypothetical protein
MQQVAKEKRPSVAGISYQEKKKRLEKVQNELSQFSGPTAAHHPYLTKIAKMLVCPGETEPVLFPRPFPIKEGCARFPITTSIVGTATQSDFGIIAQPVLDTPLQVTTVVDPSAESTDAIGSEWSYYKDVCKKADATVDCNINGQYIGGKVALPLYSTATVTFSVKAAGPFTNGMQLRLSAYNGATWTIILSTSGLTGIDEYTSGGHSWSPTYTHYALEIVDNGFMSFSADIKVALTPSAGTWRCRSGPIQSAMQVYTPKWGNLLNVVDSVMITAMDVLVTFEGSSYSDGGSIAVCDSDIGMPIEEDDFYETITKRAYYMSRNRLAPKGEEVGGAHWFCMPSTITQLMGYDPTPGESNGALRAGYVGIKGLKENEVVRVHMNVVVQYRTNDPTYLLKIPPPMKDLSPLLYLIGQHIEPQGCNSKHFEKLRKAGTFLAPKIKAAYDHRDDIAGLAKTVAKLAPLLML